MAEEASPISERFEGERLDPRLSWRNPPPRWRVDPAVRELVIETAAETDFWQRTHYGFRVDNGHFLHATVGGDFVLTTHVRFAPAHQYDQAGLMVYLSPDCWLKTSVEYEPQEASRLGTVVTNAGYSDWATQEFPAGRDDLWLRIRREATDYIVEHSADGQRWVQMRMAHLAEDQGREVQAGLYACSPKGAGFMARFDRLHIQPGRVR